MLHPCSTYSSPGGEDLSHGSHHVECAWRDLAQNGERADHVEELFELRVDPSGERLPVGAGRELARGRAARTISIRRLMAAASATEVPPNF
jgi:hypothetical protein